MQNYYTWGQIADNKATDLRNEALKRQKWEQARKALRKLPKSR